MCFLRTREVDYISLVLYSAVLAIVCYHIFSTEGVSAVFSGYEAKKLRQSRNEQHSGDIPLTLKHEHCGQFVEFEIQSNFASPVIHIEVRGSFESESYSYFFIGDGIHDRTGKDTISVTQCREKLFRVEYFRESPSSKQALRWRNVYRLFLSPPKPGRYEMVVRLEHTRLEDALKDLPQLSEDNYVGETYNGTFFFYQANSDVSKEKVNDFSQAGLDHGIWFRTAQRDERSIQGFDIDWPYQGTCGEIDSFLSHKRQSHISISVLGDSQPSYECMQLKNSVGKKKGLAIECINIKGAMVPSSLAVQKYPSSAEFFKGNITLASSRHKSSHSVLLLNLAGLWEVAYGGLNAQTSKLESLTRMLLLEATKSSFDEVFYMTTTQVSPLQYKGFHKDKRKWAMNQPRVERLNQLTRNIIKENFQSTIGIIDTGEMSRCLSSFYREGDMRHFNAIGNEKILRFILCNLESNQ
mmetsp:Transcript_401/g.614  ORF Transcript_401/g.614 Transcript_401/m.614 type:complete len:467 (-) Transcript_401:84-1484(-)